MNKRLHRAWDASLTVCEILGMDVEVLADGHRPYTRGDLDAKIMNAQSKAVDLALLLRAAVEEDEQKEYELVKGKV